MARTTFAYVGITIPPTPPFPNGQVAQRPLVLATLTAKNGSTFRCIVELDSGADHCVFPVSFAIAMKLDTLQMKQQLTGGVGSSGNTTFYDELTIDIGNGIKFTTQVGFTLGLEAQGIGLLGQLGFFENYNVTFEQGAKLFHVDTAGPAA